MDVLAAGAPVAGRGQLQGALAAFERDDILHAALAVAALADHDGFSAVIDVLARAGRDPDGHVVVDKVVGMEARGFILGAPVALALGTGFVPVRKEGKLPGATHATAYDLEYGTATLELHPAEVHDTMTFYEFFKGEGLAVYEPDVAAFRAHAQQMYLESEFAKDWPEGMVDQVNAVL